MKQPLENRCKWTGGKLEEGRNHYMDLLPFLAIAVKAYLEFTTNMNENAILCCHQNAFDYFGGVLEEALYDNMKTVVITRNKYGTGHHGYQKTFLDFAKHF